MKQEPKPCGTRLSRFASGAQLSVTRFWPRGYWNSAVMGRLIRDPLLIRGDNSVFTLRFSSSTQVALLPWQLIITKCFPAVLTRPRYHDHNGQGPLLLQCCNPAVFKADLNVFLRRPCCWEFGVLSIRLRLQIFRPSLGGNGLCRWQISREPIKD